MYFVTFVSVLLCFYNVIVEVYIEYSIWQNVRGVDCVPNAIVAGQVRAEPSSLFYSFDIVCDTSYCVHGCTRASNVVHACVHICVCKTVMMTWAGQIHDILVNDMLAVASLATEQNY